MDHRCSYRLQLHAGFTFDHAAAIADYLARLGVSQVYCSPYLQAAPGSTHGYDVIDHSRLGEEPGGGAGHDRLVQALAREGLGQILDIVPNHMARDGRANRWWWDVLENGPSSRYAGYFDIDWPGPDDKSTQTVLAPILGDHYGRVLERGEVRIEREQGSLVVRYHEHELPLSPRTLDELLARAARRAGSDELAALAEGFARLPHARLTDAEAVAGRHRDKELLGERLARLCANDDPTARALGAEIAEMNGSPDLLDRLLRRQNYRLAFWRTASEELDYRRFFNIENLVGLRVEADAVFADTHELVLDLVRRGILAGLRIDHVDGLRDPEGYLHRLRRASGGVYTVVEKILDSTEELPGSWPVEGTSGYDFIARIGNLFVDSANEAALTACYEDLTGESQPYGEVVRAAKHQIMRDELAAEVDRLTRLLAEICDDHRRHRDHTRRELRDALREVIAAFGVYRTYVQPERPVGDSDRDQVHRAVEAARARRPDIDGELLGFVSGLLLLEHPGRAETEFALRFAQVSAPVMAKGVEDTAFYRYHRLISLNEVGGDPGVFGRPVADFHRDTAKAAGSWPSTMLTLSTHDTKRSGDVRARLHLLSEMPAAWGDAVGGWAQRNLAQRLGPWPDRNTEYLLYQTLVGAWPLPVDRVVQFMTKASREAKVHTSWIDPVAEYEEALAGFVRRVLADGGFVEDLERFLAEHHLVERGRATSLAQTTLLLTCPGVPDLYQGSELWDLSLVDPDNRRPVDYEERRRLHDKLVGADAAEARGHWEDGGIKLWLIGRLLDHRRRHPGLYRSPSYQALPLVGRKARHGVAFARGGLAVVVPRLLVGLAEDWGDTTVTLPDGDWSDVLSGRFTGGGTQPVAGILSSLPVAVLTRSPTAAS